MSLNTNGWDYIYTITLQKLNANIAALIASGSNFNNFFIENIQTTLGTDVYTIVISKVSKLTVKNTSLYNKLELTIVFNGTYKIGSNSVQPFAGVEATFTINIDWLNKNTNTVSTITDISVDILNFADLTDTTNFLDIFKKYVNEKEIAISGDVTTTIYNRYDKYYKFFASLNTFSSQAGCEWMKPTTQRFSVKSDVHKDLSDTSCFFSFSCMIGTNTNNDPGYVDLNAIPAEASSALVIERSHFGENMVKAAFAKNSLLFDNVNTNLEKNGNYAFTNKVDLILKSKDYIDEKTTAVNGTVRKDRLLLSVEESNIKLSGYANKKWS